MNADQLRVLAERCYPGLKSSDLCSRHRENGHVECTVCYPDLPALVRAHNALKHAAWDRLRELGEQIPALNESE